MCIHEEDILSLEQQLTGYNRHARWEAGDQLRQWFEQAWREKQGQKHSTTALRRCELIRSLLSRLCCQGDAELTETILTAALEHLFQNPDILRFFSEWKKDAPLRPIYTEAVYLATGFKDMRANTRRK